MRRIILCICLYFSILLASSVITIPSGASWTQPESSYLQVDEITVAEGGSFIAANPDVVSVTPTGSGDICLPVVLSYFYAQTGTKVGSVLLMWATESETENLGFVIDRMLADSDEDWNEIATYLINDDLRGQGTCTQRTEYMFTDKTVECGKSYDYRLADVNYSGLKAYYSESVQEISIPVFIPEEYSLQQNYPNPLNPTTTIEFAITESQNIKLQVFDVTGRLVETLVDEYKAIGKWDVTWNADNYNSGIYIYRLQFGEKQISKKMLLLK